MMLVLYLTNEPNVTGENSSPPGADELLPVFTLTLSQAAIANAPHLTAFMEMHHDSQLQARPGYVHAVWSAAIDKICTCIDAPQPASENQNANSFKSPVTDAT